MYANPRENMQPSIFGQHDPSTIWEQNVLSELASQVATRPDHPVLIVIKILANLYKSHITLFSFKGSVAFIPNERESSSP